MREVDQLPSNQEALEAQGVQVDQEGPKITKQMLK